MSSIGKYRMFFPAILALVATSPARAGDKTWERISDIGSYSLMGVAIAAPLIDGDGKGTLQAAGSIGAAQLIALGLKETFPETRPDGSDDKSFPSGHTARSFAAAATLFERQGPEYGLPAFAVATLVGVARVKADKHYWYDAVAGAAIGLGTGFLITSKRENERIAVIPWGDTKGAGVHVAMRF